MTNKEAERILAMLKHWRKDKDWSNWVFYPGPRFWMVTSATIHLYPSAAERYGLDEIINLLDYCLSFYPMASEITTILASIQGTKEAHHLGAKGFFTKCVRKAYFRAAECSVRSIRHSDMKHDIRSENLMDWMIRRYRRVTDDETYEVLVTIEWVDPPSGLSPHKGLQHRFYLTRTPASKQVSEPPDTSHYSVLVPSVNGDCLYVPDISQHPSVGLFPPAYNSQADIDAEDWIPVNEPLSSKEIEFWQPLVAAVIDQARPVQSPSPEDPLYMDHHCCAACGISGVRLYIESRNASLQSIRCRACASKDAEVELLPTENGGSVSVEYYDPALPAESGGYWAWEAAPETIRRKWELMEDNLREITEPFLNEEI